MIAPINPQNEQNRAQAIVNSLTDYDKAVDVMTRARRQGEQIRTQAETAEPAAKPNRNNGQSIQRAFNALKLNQHRVVDETA